MYKIFKKAAIGSFFVRGYYLTKRYGKKSRKNTLIFLRSPKHFNAGKHKVFFLNNYAVYKVNTRSIFVDLSSIEKYEKYFFDVSTTLRNYNVLYNVTSLRLRAKLKILW